MTTLTATAHRRRIVVRGIVQGVGFRPFVHRLAYALGLVGHVKNQNGDVHIESNDIIGYLEKTVAKLPQDAYAHASLAGALRMASRYNDAMHAYQVALSLDPENLEFHNNVAALHFLRNDTTAAIRTYHYIVEKAPETVDAWLNLGVLYALSGDNASARRAWQAALHQQPDHPDAKRYLARLGS